MMVALAHIKVAVSDYSHLFIPKKFGEPQVFACLVVNEFEKGDHRGVRQGDVCGIYLFATAPPTWIRRTVSPLFRSLRMKL
jgi:hypothetical protein